MINNINMIFYLYMPSNILQEVKSAIKQSKFDELIYITNTSYTALVCDNIPCGYYFQYKVEYMDLR
jgi:hypothetical protein